MAGRSRIEWTEVTWNPVTGCTKVSEGCRRCYAERMSNRLRSMGVRKYRRGFEVATHPETLSAPLRWRRPRLVFVNSMSDLFHEAVPDGFIASVFDVMVRTPRHVYQILTKRPARARDFLRDPDLRRRLGGGVRLPLPNVWLGTSAEDQQTLNERIVPLLQTPAAVRWISAEPLLEEVTVFSVDGPVDVYGGEESPLHWVVCGGESGPGARPMRADWARSLRDQCAAVDVPFFFKQWGGRNKKRAGRVLDGRTWDGMPRTGRRGLGGPAVG